jgi:hypothetical protein
MEEKLVEIITQMQAVAPAATAQAIHAVWLEGVVNLLTCLVGLGVVASLGKVTLKLYAAGQKSTSDFPLPSVVAWISAGVATLLLIAAIFGVLSTSAWIAAIDPQSALALKIIAAAK